MAVAGKVWLVTIPKLLYMLTLGELPLESLSPCMSCGVAHTHISCHSNHSKLMEDHVHVFSTQLDRNMKHVQMYIYTHVHIVVSKHTCRAS